MADENNGKSPSAVNAVDPLDERVRAALQVLDASVPAGYHELGAASVMARLDEAKHLPALPDLEKSMSNDTSSSVPTPIGTEISQVPMRAVVPAGAPPVASRSSEDSGLHDLKSLAASAKNRITTRRTMPPIDDEALLSSASASFKAMALPEPARIVSLPNPGLVPALARAPKATQSELTVAATATASDLGVTNSPYSAPAKAKSNKNLFIIGGGVAAVAAVAAFVVMNKKGNNSTDNATAKAPAAVVAAPQRDEAALAPATPPTVPVAAPAAAAPEVVADTAATAGAGAAVAETRSAKSDKPAKDVKDIKAVPDIKDAKPADVKAGAKADPKAVTTVPPKPDGDAGSVDDLLKEAGVNVAAKEAKPTLDKKELTRDDIASVMKGRTGAAQACLAKNGVTGTVGVKLSVAPSGKVSKAVATGPLAGTPTGDCVVNAVSGSTFPAWDGRPTTVIYSYLLSE